jgi:hypothetical protein
MPSSSGMDVFNSTKTSNNQDVFAIGTSGGGSAQGSNATVAVYYVKTSDEVIPTDVTPPYLHLSELRFTPSPNKKYLVEVWMYTTTALTTNTLQWGITPTVSADISENVKMMYVPATATVWTVTSRNDKTGLSQNSGSSTLDADQYGWAIIQTASSISGTIGIEALCVTAGQTFTCKAGSFLRVREIA